MSFSNEKALGFAVKSSEINKNEHTGFVLQAFVKKWKVNDVHTEFVFQVFANKWFVLITQYGRVPNLYAVRFDLQRSESIPIINNPELHISIPVTINCAFGADKDEVRSGIQYLVNKSKLNRCPQEFIISLGLKEINGSNLNEVAKILDEIIT
uniref:Uncharacterized protein n=1 Tax=Glossina brevipalpis TaxID=37001 RepID=A0A1A9WUS0_9MUSC